MSGEIIKPIEFLKERRYRLPIKFETKGLAIDVYATSLDEAIQKFRKKKSNYLPLPKDDEDSPSAYMNQTAVIENGDFELNFEDEEALKEFFEFMQRTDKDFSAVTFFDCTRCQF